MGFFEFGQSTVAIGVFVVVLLMIFGGMPNNDVITSYTSDTAYSSTSGINVVGFDTNTSLSGTEFATTTSTDPSNDNDSYLNAAFGFLGDAYNLFAQMPSAIGQALNFAGIPYEIQYAVGVPLLIFMSLGILFFLLNASGIAKGGGLT